MIASLDKLAWYEHSRGQTCCAQQAHLLADQLRSLAAAEMMGATKESGLA